MGKGRKPKPIAQHLADGTYRHDRHGGNHPEPVSGVPKCPKGLSAAAKKVWRDLVKVLGETGVLTKADVFVMARYCTAQARMQAAEAEIDKASLAAPEAGALYNIIRGESQEVYRLGGLLGLDPSSRAKLQVTPKANVETAVPIRDRYAEPEQIAGKIG